MCLQSTYTYCAAMPQHILEEQNHGSTRRTRGITHKYSTEHIVVSLLWQYDIRMFFVNIFTEVPVSRHGCSVLHVLTWRRGSLCLFACRNKRQHNTEISIPARQIITCSYHQIYYRNRIPWCKQNHLPTIKGKASNCIVLLQFFYFFTK